MPGTDVQALAWLITRLKCCGPWTVLGKGVYRERLWREMAKAGIDSIPTVTVISAAAGVILALQAAIQLGRIGAMSYVANLVGVTIIRELGPLLTALIAIGRSGAAYTAEIGTMQVTEELDAMEVMGLDPVRFLVWPKLLALVLTMPCLALWADLIGILAGGLFTTQVLGVNASTYFDQTVSFLQKKDIVQGVVKSAGFAAAITLIGCWQGFLAKGGASDVGARTTASVVKTIFAVIILDLIFTALNYLVR